ncbi:hypothetical protein CFC21_079313 [Triticum aestivum]|nr:hypothetical protein CFC21_079313 [Triticum aestivum]
MGRRRRNVEIPSEILHDILMKLTTRDVARSCCISRQWRAAVSDPFFRSTHANAMAMAGHAAAPAEVLLVSKTCEPGLGDEVSASSMSTGKDLRSFAVPGGYDLANVCHGLLCYVHRAGGPEAPAVVCNPATGETLALPKPPPLAAKGRKHLFALGFSPPTNEYKLFRFSPFSMDVYTLGDTAGWRQHLRSSSSCPTQTTAWAPLLIDGKLYMPTNCWKRVLVVDVVTETCRSYGLPEVKTFDGVPLVGAFELEGRLCLAIHEIIHDLPRGLNLWIMSLPPEDGNEPPEDGNEPPLWEPRHRFDIDEFYATKPWSAWADDGGEMLCYMHGNTLHKYDKRGRPPKSEQLRLPEIPSAWRSSKCRWSIHGGYHLTLLSPLTFALPPSKDKHQFKHTLSRVLYDAIRPWVRKAEEYI